MASLGKVLSWVIDVVVFLLVIIFSVAALQAPYAWGWWLLVVVGLVFIFLTNPLLVQKFAVDQRIKARRIIAGLLVIPAIVAVFIAVNQKDEHDFFVRNGETMAEYNLAVERYNAISDADDHRGSNAANRQAYKETCDKKVGLACFKYALLLAKEGNYKEAMDLNAGLCRMDFDTIDADGPMTLDKADTASACYNAGVHAGKAGDREEAIKFERVVCESHAATDSVIPACAELGMRLSEGSDDAQIKEAIVHLRRACDAKDLGACYNLSLQYASGHGVDYDKNYAIELADRVCNKQGEFNLTEGDVAQKGCATATLVRKAIDKCERTADGISCRYYTS